MISEITQEEVKAVFHYESGQLYRKKNNKLMKAIDNRGYIGALLNTKRCRVHQLIYIYHYGNIPQGMYIDHIDNNTQNNFPENLRLVTPLENAWNKGKLKNKKIKGYYYDENRKRYRAQITINKKKIHLGSFKAPEEAEKAYLEAKKIHHNIPDRQ
jgi:hypothetical protein